MIAKSFGGILLMLLVSSGTASIDARADKGMIGQSTLVKRGEKMGFENAYASDEDIEKYDLNGVWDRYNPSWKGDYYHGRRPDFTVDRENDVFLMALSQGYGEDGNLKTMLFRWGGLDVRVGLRLVEGSSAKFSERPFFRVWDLDALSIPTNIIDQKTEIIDQLKEAVRTRGYRGAQKQIPNTIVKFNF